MVNREGGRSVGVRPIELDVSDRAGRWSLGHAAEGLDAMRANFVRWLVDRNLGRSDARQASRQMGGWKCQIVVVGDLQANVKARSKECRLVERSGRVDLCRSEERRVRKRPQPAG